MTKGGTAIAKMFSAVLQPLLMPLYSVALLSVYTNFYHVFAGQALRFVLPVFTFTFLFPCMFMFFLWRLGYIRDFNLTDKNERVFPYIVFIVANLSLTYFFFSAGVYIWFIALVLAPSVIALAGLIINFFCRISAHMMGIGGLIGGVLSVSFNVKGANPILLMIILFLLAGCLGVSRLYLQKDKPIEVYLGFLVGLILAYIVIFAAVFSFVISYK